MLNYFIIVFIRKQIIIKNIKSLISANLKKTDDTMIERVFEENKNINVYVLGSEKIQSD